MSNRPKILIVEHDDRVINFGLKVLSSEYEVLHVKTGQAALKFVQDDLPDLILLNTNMPDMSGYEVCQTLRDNEDIGLLPVIFLSSLSNDEERLAGYEAGGDDYITKPLSIKELLYKIKLQLTIQTERNRLKADLTHTRPTTATTVPGIAEIGIALQFLRSSLTCSTYADLCHEILNTLGTYGLKASVQIHGQQGIFSLGTDASCSPLENFIPTDRSNHGRLFESTTRISCSYDHITISVAYDDLNSYHHIKDNLAIIAEGANAHILALDKCITLTKQHATLSQLTANTRQALQHIEYCHREHEIKNNQLFQELQERFLASVPTIGITDSQKEKLTQIFSTAANKAKVLFNEGLETGTHLNNILQQLENVGNLTSTGRHT